MMPEFTTDWFSQRIPSWKHVLGKFRDKPISVLEIGSFEGRSATFLLEYLPQCRITCIDPFFAQRQFTSGYEARFDANIAPFGDRVRKIKSRSVPALDALANAGERFDVIYVDGSHERQDVLCDSIMVWPLLNTGGILIWDDWKWKRDELPPEQRPEQAIDLFCYAFAGCFKLLHREYQVIVEKLSEWPEAQATVEREIGCLQQSERPK